MNLLNLFRRSRPDDEARAIIPLDSLFGGSVYFGGGSDAGVCVTPEVALTASAVWACVGVISSTISTLPVHIVNKEDGGKDRKHPLASLLAEPNEFMTGASFKEALLVNLLLFGNAYCVIERDETGQPVALYPLQSRCTQPRRYAGQLVYDTRVDNKQFTFSQFQIAHVPSMSFDGILGLSPIQYARNSIGLSLALEKFASMFFANGANAGGFVVLGPMRDDAIKDFQAKWKAQYTGVSNAFRTATLPPGSKYEPRVGNLEQSQTVQQRVHQLREVARIYRVPAHKIGDLERATFSNIEQMGREFSGDCILPWTVRIEQELTRKLLSEADKQVVQVRFNLDGILRADTLTRYQAHNLGLQGGFLTRNEVRAMESLPPIEGGDTLLVPLNMGPANGQPNNAPNSPAPALMPADAQKS